MTPGTILFHKNFIFDDGDKADKRLVFLTDRIDDFFYVVAKTTSQANRKGKNSGCQHENVYPNFFIPQGTTRAFHVDTWVILTQLYELRHAAIIQPDPSCIKIIGSMNDELTKNLLNCTLKLDDITPHQEMAIRRVLNKL